MTTTMTSDLPHSVADDLGETDNVAAQSPERVNVMTGEFETIKGDGN
jgi:hypothetical protein